MFELIKLKLTTTPILMLMDFDFLFELYCDASNLGVEVVSSQQSFLIDFFSE